MSNTAVQEILQEYKSFELEDAQRLEVDQLLNAMKVYHQHFDEDLVRRAFILCFVSHKTMVRASGEPYYLHPLEVANIVARDLKLDDISVAAALLHDVVEDTPVTIKDIEVEFGKAVSHIISGLTKVSGAFKDKDVRQAETFLRLLLHMAQDLKVLFIKFADRLHNMRTLKHLPKHKQIKIATETLEIYAPLAHRCGIYSLKNELEDLCLKYLDPTSYKFIARKLKEKKDAREKFVNAFMEPLRDKLEASGFRFEIKGRPKHIYSIYRKMRNQSIGFDQIYDLFAIRIILEDPHTKEDCWRVYSMITDMYKPIPERFKDFINIPKKNGYQSIHSTVITDSSTSESGQQVEIQIRTRKMDDVAEEGVAAHYKYKEGTTGVSPLDEITTWIRSILDNPMPDMMTDFVNDFRLNLFSEEIYVFTPKGELKTLPKGATAIDFAFEIHSEVGERTVGARVNQQMVPVRHELKSGDQVEIITGKTKNLSPDWINYVKTHKAIARIRAFIKAQEKEKTDSGRELFRKKMGKLITEIDDSDLIKVAHRLKYTSVGLMYHDIGIGNLEVGKVIKTVKMLLLDLEREEIENKAIRITEKEIQEQFYDSARAIGDNGLIINGSYTNIRYSYAKCCNPIPGDEVIGFLSRAGDVKIHRNNCSNVPYLVKTESERVIDVKWPKKVNNQFVGALKIIGYDRQGLVTDITSHISRQMNTNMKSISVVESNGMFEGSLILYVADLQHLERIIRELKSIQGVKDVFRFD